MTLPWFVRCAAPLPVLALPAGCSDEVAGGNVIALPRGESLGELRTRAGGALARYDAAVSAAGPSATPSVRPPSWDATNPPAGLAIEAAKVSGTGAGLTVTFTGARGPATESCGADHHAEAVESARAVVVIVIAQPHAAGEICPLVGYTRTATVNLARPLGERAVLEVRQGTTVPLTTA